MNSFPSATSTLRETQEPEGQAWMFEVTVPEDQMGSGPHPMNRRVLRLEDGLTDVLTDVMHDHGAVGTITGAFALDVAMDLERTAGGDDVREGAKPKASLVANRPTRRDAILMVLDPIK